MTRRVLWVTSLTVAAVACSLAYWHFIPRRLPPPHLTVANLPRVPMQPSSGFIRCSGGLDFKLDNASGDWSVVQDHPPCDVSGSALPAVKATAIEMARVYRRPLVAFRVLPSGLIRDISLLYSSGSASLDRRALAQLSRIRYPRHNCCSCRVSLLSTWTLKGLFGCGTHKIFNFFLQGNTSFVTTMIEASMSDMEMLRQISAKQPRKGYVGVYLR